MDAAGSVGRVSSEVEYVGGSRVFYSSTTASMPLVRKLKVARIRDSSKETGKVDDAG